MIRQKQKNTRLFEKREKSPKNVKKKTSREKIIFSGKSCVQIFVFMCIIDTHKDFAIGCFKSEMSFFLTDYFFLKLLESSQKSDMKLAQALKRAHNVYESCLILIYQPQNAINVPFSGY